MNIRLAGAAEAAILTRLDHACMFSAHWNEKQWQAELAQPACRVWCAETNGKMVGFLTLRGAADQYEITNLAVEPAMRRSGIGTRLLTHALEKLPGGDVTLEVSTQNTAAIELYTRCGFVCRAVRKQFYKDGSDAWIMGKPL